MERKPSDPNIPPMQENPGIEESGQQASEDIEIGVAETKPEATRVRKATELFRPDRPGRKKALEEAEKRREEAGERIREIISEAPEDLQHELMEFVAEAEEEDTDPEKLLVEVMEKNGKAEANAEIVYTKMEANLPVKPDEIDDLGEERAGELLDKFIQEVVQEPENIPADKQREILKVYQLTEFVSGEEAFTERNGETAEIAPEISKIDALKAISTIMAT